jgi:hypothetical protein
MTWKSTALVSGATLLAGWLASAPPVNNDPSSAVPARSPQTAAAESDIEQQAARLQTRTREEPPAYGGPERNLFRFGSKEAPPADAAEPRRVSAGESPAPTPAEVVPQPPQPPPVSLSGVASDGGGERATVRTAILSSPEGVLLVHQGDQVLGQYRVGAIGDDSVELTRTADGTSFRLTLKP